MTSEIAFLKIRLLPSQGKFRTRLELMAAVNTKETLKELSIEISVVRMELIKQNLVIISFKKHKLGSALGDPFNQLNRVGRIQILFLNPDATATVQSRENLWEM